MASVPSLCIAQDLRLGGWSKRNKWRWGLSATCTLRQCAAWADGEVGRRYLVVFGGAWWCVVVLGCAWWCAVVRGGVWWCVVGAWGCVVVFGGVWWCMVGYMVGYVVGCMVGLMEEV